jgi:general secretion pathway protein G
MRSPSRPRSLGFTLVELLITLVIIGTLAAIAIPSYVSYMGQSKNGQAEKDIAELSMAIERHRSDNSTYPASLAALPSGLPANDPWGNAYQYLAIDVTPAPSSGSIRRDKNMNPLNSDFDLYSKGPDGLTQVQLTASTATDDIVRAGNGGFVGVAAEH